MPCRRYFIRKFNSARDIPPPDLECVTDANFRQHRGGAPPADYLDRLARGCLLRRLVTELDGRPTQYSSLITDVVRYRVSEGSESVSEAALSNLQQDMMKQAEERYREVARCWQSDEFSGTMSFEWARGRSATDLTGTCTAVVEDAIAYLKLVLRWPVFVRAIDRLPFDGNFWLFDSRGLEGS